MKKIIFSLCLTTKVFAHGEAKLGPHGGHINMPSSFHVELVEKDKTIRIYLLDVNFKNPVTENSSVMVKAMTQKSGPEVSCKPE